ncbi:MAG TPA: sulfatase-like hydrolase/transferase, partial [Planctomycetaceae bacterium]
MQRRILLFGAALALLAGLSFFLWPDRFRHGLFRSGPKPNLLLVTLDTTRADRLFCYGYAAGQTPVLDSLAADGVLCERAFTVAPITLSAHTSMFTGLYPAENGVVTNGRGRLDDSIPTMAEVLQREGYDTGAFVASFVLNGKFGLNRGFGTYDDEFASAEPDSDTMHRQRPGESVVTAALEWLGAKREKPFFCWVHLYDPHAPYLPHTDLFGEKFADRPYDAEIAYVDQQVGRLVDFLKGSHADDQTLVVVVGDHGEGLGEHVEREHGMTLYDDTMHVPLIFRQRGKLLATRRVEENVSLIDLSPTILDLLGLKDPRKTTGHSLKRALAGDEKATGIIFGGTDIPFLVNEWSPLRMLIEGDWKYIRTTKPELYDLAADPQERRNLLEADSEIAGKMKTRLADFEKRLAPREAIAVQLTAHELRALKDLNYIGGSKVVPVGPAPADLPDVKDMLPFDIEVEDAMKLVRGSSVKEAMDRLRDIIRRAPSLTDAYWNLAGLLRAASEFGEAEEVLRKMLAVKPESAQGHSGLAVVLMQQGQTAEAITEFRKTIDIDPDNAEARSTLARLLLAEGKTDEALAQWNAALEVDPQHVASYQARATVLSRLGRTAEAVADYRSALKYAPDAADTHLRLGILLADEGD